MRIRLPEVDRDADAGMNEGRLVVEELDGFVLPRGACLEASLNFLQVRRESFTKGGVSALLYLQPRPRPRPRISCDFFAVLENGFWTGETKS